LILNVLFCLKSILIIEKNDKRNETFPEEEVHAVGTDIMYFISLADKKPTTIT
jgi:hypothetical protein